MASDTPDQNLSQYFSVCNDFIHAARLRDGNVLIHCLAGMSRSVTVAVAYIMSVTPLSWKESLKVVRTGRSVANPNAGFQGQLQDFEMFRLTEVSYSGSHACLWWANDGELMWDSLQERRRLKERFPTLALEVPDRHSCSTALTSYERLLLNRDICEGNCVRGSSCPTGATSSIAYFIDFSKDNWEQ